MISGTLIHQHTVITLRYTHDVVAACGYQKGCQVLDIVLVSFHMVGVACVTSHRDTGQFAHEVILKNSEYAYKYDRSQDHHKREKTEIGISAVRGGTIVGDHDVIFAGTDEVITFSHTAYSRAIFGKGAIQAAKFLAGKPAGYYHMSDVIDAQA